MVICIYLVNDCIIYAKYGSIEHVCIAYILVLLKTMTTVLLYVISSCFVAQNRTNQCHMDMNSLVL